jgi:dTDP-4-amino-4,6-dideoxygalactose transaminase
VKEVNKVPFLDLRRHGPEVDGELENAFRRVLQSGQYIMGPEVEALEQECAAYIGARYAIGVSSGTDALILALMTLGIGPGDEVICPTYTFFAPAGAIGRVGARPVFCDIAPTCYNCDPESVAKCITDKTKAIIPVHLFGQCAHMSAILSIAADAGVCVVEDAAQAIGAQCAAGRAGSMGAMGCFSFFPSKNLGALGDAGLVTTHDAGWAAKAKILRKQGAEPKHHHHAVGGNFRIDALQSALIRVKLKRLDDCTARRQNNARLYDKLFTESGIAAQSTCESGSGAQCRTSPVAESARLLLPAVCQPRHIFNQYVVRVRGEGVRDKLRDFLRWRNVGTEIYYPVPMHMQKCFESLGYRAGAFPIAEQAARETLALPIFPELTQDEIRYVVEQVVGFWG